MNEENKDVCLLTGHAATVQSDVTAGIIYVDSKACGGAYGVVFDTRWDLSDKDDPKINQFKLNCARKSLEIIRQHTDRVIPIWTSRSNAENLKQFFLEDRNSAGKPKKIVCAGEDAKEEYVDHSEKPYVLLESIANRLYYSGPYSQFLLTEQDQVWARIVDKQELTEIVFFLKEKGYIKIHLSPKVVGTSLVVERIFEIKIQMTVAGWEKIKEQHKQSQSNKVFIATQFQWPENNDLRLKVINNIKKACKDLGFEADIVSQNHTENVTDRIVAEIKQARFVIAELTYNNRGVYYEAGLARGLGIPVFHLVKEGFASGLDNEGKKIHFDIQQIMYREWNNEDQVYSILKDWIGATIVKHP